MAPQSPFAAPHARIALALFLALALGFTALLAVGHTPTTIARQANLHWIALRTPPTADSAHTNLADEVPETAVLQHVPGFTLLESLYLKNGVMYIVSDNRTGDVPRLWRINHGTAEDDEIDEPSYIDMISPEEARKVLGDVADNYDGLSILFSDDWDGLAHAPHFLAEGLMGAWRLFSSYMTSRFSSTSALTVPFPKRLFLYKIEPKAWHDIAFITPFVVRSGFPGISIMHKSDWDDMKQSEATIRFEKAVIFDRLAAHHTDANRAANKVLEDIAVIPAHRDWWEPVRRSVLLACVGFEKLNAGLHARSRQEVLALPAGSEEAGLASPTTLADVEREEDDRPMVLYISRDLAFKRKLLPAARKRFVAALRADRRFRFVEAVMERMSLREQIALASKADVMIGVHGSGLTHALWMPATSRSTVIEIMQPGGWARDFYVIARALGHQHRAIWGSRIIRAEEHDPAMIINEGFHGVDIPVDVQSVLEWVFRQSISYFAWLNPAQDH